METSFRIIALILLLGMLSCSKSNTNAPVSIITPSVPTPATPTLPDSAIFYDQLSILTKQGASWDCVRYDTLGGTPLLGNQFNLYSANWEKKLVFDTSDKLSPNYGTYRDSTIETITVSGKITIGDLKKYFGTTTGINPNYTYFNGASSFTYIVNNFSTVQASDTSNCSILLIKNKTRNTTDTEFVFLSKQYFAIIPQISTISIYAAAPASNQKYISTDASLPSLGIELSRIKKGGDSFTYQNNTYQGDILITDGTSFRAPSGIQGSNDNSYLLISSAKGLIRHYNIQSSYSPISHPFRKVNRINLMN